MAKKATAKEEESTVNRRLRMEKIPKGELSSLFMEGNHLRQVHKKIKYKNRLIIMFYSYVY